MFIEYISPERNSNSQNVVLVIEICHVYQLYTHCFTKSSHLYICFYFCDLKIHIICIHTYIHCIKFICSMHKLSKSWDMWRQNIWKWYTEWPDRKVLQVCYNAIYRMPIYKCNVGVCTLGTVLNSLGDAKKNPQS